MHQLLLGEVHKCLGDKSQQDFAEGLLHLVESLMENLPVGKIDSVITCRYV